MLRTTVAVLALGLLTACGQPTATQEDTAPAATVAEEPADLATGQTDPAMAPADTTATAPAPAAAPTESYSPPED